MFLAQSIRRETLKRREKMKEMVWEGEQAGKSNDEAKQVEELLQFAVAFSNTGAKSRVWDILEVATGTGKELLEAALNETKLKQMFPEGILLKYDMTKGMSRLRQESDGRWVVVVCGRANDADTVAEIRDYLQYVRLPKMAFRLLKTMGAEMVPSLVTLTAEQYAGYCEAESSAREVLKKAVDKLGLEQTAALMNVDSYSIRGCLAPPNDGV